jgi:hypothetical protein
VIEAEGEQNCEAEVEDVGPEERGEAAESEAKAVDEDTSFGHVVLLSV